MADIKFVNGFSIKTVQTQYGEILNCSIDTEAIFNNPTNNEKWINFSIKKSKSGNYYAQINEYKKD